MKLKKLLAALASASLLCGVGAAHASVTFKFNPTGGGAGAGVINGGITLDQAPGNDLAINGAGTTHNGLLTVGSVIQDLYQANLAVVLGAGSSVLYSNGTGSNYFTFVGSFAEQVIASSAVGTTVTNSFQLLNGSFKMCRQAAAGNDLAGTGFACAGNGILHGTINGGFATQTGFLTNLVPLDQSGSTNDWPGVQSVTSSGAATITATIDFADANYFPDLPVGTQIVMSAINSSLITPYNQVDPSRKFSSNGVANGDVSTNIGAIDGISGPDFLFQADANSSFSTTALPEPGALALVGIALTGLSLARRRQK